MARHPRNPLPAAACQTKGDHKACLYPTRSCLRHPHMAAPSEAPHRLVIRLCLLLCRDVTRSTKWCPNSSPCRLRLSVAVLPSSSSASRSPPLRRSRVDSVLVEAAAHYLLRLLRLLDRSQSCRLKPRLCSWLLQSTKARLRHQSLSRGRARFLQRSLLQLEGHRPKWTSRNLALTSSLHKITSKHPLSYLLVLRRPSVSSPSTCLFSGGIKQEPPRSPMGTTKGGNSSNGQRKACIMI